MITTNIIGENTITTYQGDDARKRLVSLAIDLLRSEDPATDETICTALCHLETALEHIKPVVVEQGVIDPADKRYQKRDFHV